jgi:hypothetical protein
MIRKDEIIMQDQEKIKALFAVMTGYRSEERQRFFLDRSDLLQSASILFSQLAPTEEQIGTLLMLKFGEIQEEHVESAKEAKTPQDMPLIPVVSEDGVSENEEN